MSISRVKFLGLAMALAVATVVWAGGFYVNIYSGKAPVAQGIADAVVVVAAEGCGTPSLARMSGTAEGLVAGKRHTVHLKFTSTSKPGVYAVKKQWPAEGAWVLSITGKYLGAARTQIVRLEPNGNFRAEMVKNEGELTSQIEAALRAAAKST